MANKFKPNGIWLTRGLFLETSYMDQSSVLFTLKDEDDSVRNLPSLYKLYMACEDLTEYDFATTHLGGWDHWQQIVTSAFFKPYITKWRKEMEIKIKSQALKALREEAASGGKSSFAANKFLVEKGWIERPEGKRGRPTKDEIKQDLNQRDLTEAFQRMNTEEAVN